MNNNKLIKGFTWTAIERFSIQFVQFIIGVIIARLVSPSEYGILGILMVFITISQVFIDSGFGSALIYNNDLKKEDLQTTFTFNLIVSLVLYIILYLVSPFIESFYELYNLSLYIRVSGTVLFINSLMIVPISQLKVWMNFRALAISGIVSTVLSGLIGIYLAYANYGIWALIVQLLSRSLFQSVLLIIQCKWLPNFSFYKDSFFRLYKYGVNVFSASILTKMVDEGIVFLIGKIITPYSLGLFTRANQFASLPTTSLGTIVSSVLFPSLSSLKEEDYFNKIYLTSIKYQGLLSIPIFMLIVVISEPMIRLFLTDKWLEVVPILQILCLGRIIAPVTNITEQAINAKGRSDLFLKQQSVKLIIKSILVLISLPFGIIYVAIADAIYTLSQFFITNYYGCKVIKISILQILKTIYPFIITGIIALSLSFFISIPIKNDLLKILISTICYIWIYFFILTAFYEKHLFNHILKFIKR